jgi:hypothetical protein
MRRRNAIIGILTLVLLGILASALWPEPPEPVYKDRKLSEYIKGAAKRGVFLNSDLHAIEAIGTNGIPFYLQWIRYRPGVLKRAEIQLAVKSRKWFHVKWPASDAGAMRAWYAHFALAQLGERAAPAIPQFLAFVTNSPPRLSKAAVLPSDGSAAVEGLANIGPPALPAYLSLLTNADPQVRAFAIGQSERFHINNSVISQLRSSLEDPDGRVRLSATNALRAYDANSGGPISSPQLR